VSNFGGISTQFQIEIDPVKLEQYHLTLSEVSDKIGKNNTNAGGSMLYRGDLSYVIRGIGLVKDLDDLGKIVVKTEKGVPIFVKDLGDLKYGNLERKGVLGFSDRTRNYDDGIEGTVQMLRYQNPSKVLEEVHKSVEELNNDILPEGVKIHPFMDRTDLVGTTLNTVAYIARRNSPCPDCFDRFPWKLARRFIGGHHHSYIIAHRIPFNAGDRYSGQSSLSWSDRFWDYR